MSESMTTPPLTQSAPRVKAEYQWSQTGALIGPIVHVRNSLSKSKVPLVPRIPNELKWYTCGPTVYDSAHLGHARAYITFDILRRILSQYFGYRINYVMNITDVDDKIILAARQTHLFEQKRASVRVLDTDLVQEVLEALTDHVQSKLSKHRKQDVSEVPAWSPGAIQNQWTQYSNDLIRPSEDSDPKFPMHLKSATVAVAALKTAARQLQAGDDVSHDAAVTLLNATRDIIGVALDKKLGHTISDPSLFRTYAATWEKAFFEDMKALGVQRPDYCTRVSEYVPEIEHWVAKIMDNKYAYKIGDSVYFDVKAFEQNPSFHYCKLEPGARKNLDLLTEGEGALVDDIPSAKRSPCDFALWKASKPGEPAWKSQWGFGRPGWHIECSVMASEILGNELDIHSGGIDLAFPHHENEIAQSEAFFNKPNWCRYFIHAGHLHIEGQKMSKSLKNFITIREALEKYPASRIRLLFLMHDWDGTLDWKESALEQCRSVEQQFSKVLSVIQALQRQSEQSGYAIRSCHSHHATEKELQSKLQSCQQRIHEALCDSFNTPRVITELRGLTVDVNAYIVQGKDKLDVDMLTRVANYLHKILGMFGLSEYGQARDEQASDIKSFIAHEDVIYPYAQALSDVRDRLRQLAVDPKSQIAASQLLQFCDQMRDTTLPELGIRLDDQTHGRALVKLVDPKLIRREREERDAKTAANTAQKEQRSKRQEKFLRAKEG